MTATAPEDVIRPTEKRSPYPWLASEGKSKRPTATTVPTEVCAMAPNSSEEATVVTASEPRTPPMIETTHSTTRRAMPPCPMISPASTKNGTASRGKLSKLPNM